MSADFFKEHDIDIQKFAGSERTKIRKMIIALETLASKEDGLKSANNMLLAQPAIKEYLRNRQKDAPRKEQIEAPVAVEPSQTAVKKEKKVPIKKEKGSKEDPIDVDKPARVKQALASQQVEQIVLDSDDDGDIRIKVDQSEIVCFGVISTAFSSVQQSILHTCLGAQAHLDICIMAEPTGNPAIYALRVDSMDGHKIGYVDRKMCIAMSPLLKNLRIEGSIPRPLTVVINSKLSLIPSLPRLHFT